MAADTDESGSRWTGRRGGWMMYTRDVWSLAITHVVEATQIWKKWLTLTYLDWYDRLQNVVFGTVR